MDKAAFSSLGRNWSLTLSNGTEVVLRLNADGNTEPLDYADRATYIEQVRRIRMTEFEDQVTAVNTLYHIINIDFCGCYYSQYG